jgi:hypothetical protein
MVADFPDGCDFPKQVKIFPLLYPGRVIVLSLAFDPVSITVIFENVKYLQPGEFGGIVFVVFIITAGIE